MARLRWLRIYAILALVGSLACGDAGDGTTGDETSPTSAETETPGTSDSSAGTSDATDATSSDTSDSTSAGSSDSSAVCGPYDSDTDAQDLVPCENPDDETTPGPGDEVGGACCTLRQSCTGPEVPDGQLPAPGALGLFMTCVDGVWTVDQADCIESCHDKSSPEEPICYGGCFWRPNSIKPTCGCVQG